MNVSSSSPANMNVSSSSPAYKILGNSYRYVGGDFNQHLRWWKLNKNDEPFPCKKDLCVCGHMIKRQCYVESKSEPGKYEVIGSCCINSYTVGRSCSRCYKKHRNRITTLCNTCRYNHISGDYNKCLCDMCIHNKGNQEFIKIQYEMMEDGIEYENILSKVKEFKNHEKDTHKILKDSVEYEKIIHKILEGIIECEKVAYSKLEDSIEYEKNTRKVLENIIRREKVVHSKLSTNNKLIFCDDCVSLDIEHNNNQCQKMIYGKYKNICMVKLLCSNNFKIKSYIRWLLNKVHHSYKIMNKDKRCLIELINKHKQLKYNIIDKRSMMNP